MRDLVVVGFQGTHRAVEVLGELLDLADWATTINLSDAVAVYRTTDGRLRLNQSVKQTTREGASWGGVLGALIGGLLAVPVTGGVSALVAASTLGTVALTFGAAGAVIGGEGAAEARNSYGISEDFVRQVGGMVQPGQSALFVLAEIDEPAKLAEHFEGYGGTILRTTLRPEQAKRIQQVINADRPIAR